MAFIMRLTPVFVALDLGVRLKKIVYFVCTVNSTLIFVTLDRPYHKWHKV